MRILTFFLLFSLSTFLHAETVLFDASKPETPGTTINVNTASAEKKDGLLVLTNDKQADWPGITFKGNWSAMPDEVIVVELENQGSNTAQVTCRLDSPGANPDTGKATHNEATTLSAGETKRWEITLPRRLPVQLQDKLYGMRGYPGGARGDTDGNVSGTILDPKNLVAVWIFYGKPSEQYSVGIKRIAIAEPKLPAKIISQNEALNLPPEKFFPMIDKYGQYIHADWQGKIKTDADLKNNRIAEEKQLNAAPKPADRNQYGGWTKGPKLKATGNFYATKHNGTWWLVDPEGCLFWSHGVDCVGSGAAVTPTSERENYFAELPFDEFKGRGRGGAHGYYEEKSYETYNFTASNLMLKYGNNWRQDHAGLVHRRLQSWGMNTIANWSDSAIYGMSKTPYTATLGASGPAIAGSTGYWGQFKDPFHPDFRTNIARAMDRQKEAAADPWCIGFFVDNELGWGNDTSLAAAALASPKEQPAKVAVIEMLKKKYENIGKLNTVWNTTYADWNVMLDSITVPDVKNETVKTDLQAGYTLIAEEYFKVIRSELKKAAPNKMYFGCRFAWVNDSAIRAADKFCDLLSFNQYKYTLEGFKLPEGIDKAVLIGEFHFGALDRGMLHTGLCPTADQQERAAAYEKYVRSGLVHPNIVGTHWFQYANQATTGRSLDGENYQIGLIDVCDTPYTETIEAVKRIGSSMYELRMSSK